MASSAKTIGSIDREIRVLSGSLDDYATKLVSSYPDAEIKVRRTPECVLLQAGDFGVTVSLYRSRAGAEAGAELVLAAWKGQVTLPGSTPNPANHATRLSAQQFHIVATDDGGWLWVDEATTHTLDSSALATICVDALIPHL